LDVSDTAVLCIGAAFNPTSLFHPVYKPRDADWFNLEQFGDARLRKSVFADEVNEQPPLRSGKAVLTAARFEHPPQLARRVMDQETKRVGLGRSHKRDIR
jgi:hypothetical protein